MDKIRVYLQYPWKFPDSPYYKYLVENPPEGVEYLNVENQKGVITKKKKFQISSSFKIKTRQFIRALRISLPNSHQTKKGDYDLIHCAHCLSKNKFPWVADFEDSWQFWISGLDTNLGKKMVRKILMKEECKKIIAWTEETKKKIIGFFPEIESKIEVVYPAVPLKKRSKTKGNKIYLTFVGRYFLGKGGLHVLEAFDKLTKKYDNIECLIVSEISEEIKSRYNNEKIHFFGLMSQEELFSKILDKTDIFVYPGYSDTFGFTFLEMMSFGIPIVTVDGFARKEIIEEGKTGFIANNPGGINQEEIGEKEKGVVEELVKLSSKLIDSVDVRTKMSENCIKMIKEGKFSIQERNRKLRKIYEDARNG